MFFSSRTACTWISLVFVLSMASIAKAQTANWPNKPIKIMVGSQAGTGTDAIDHTLVTGTLNVTGINDAPTLTGLDGTAALTHIQGGAATVIDANVDLGIAYTEQGFYAEAERTFLTAIGHAPNEVLLRYHLGALYAQWQRPEDMYRRLTEAVAREVEKVAFSA
jgi:Flp pilus assembly protein TadD